jgi:phosphate transport system substrate-binding protein
VSKLVANPNALGVFGFSFLDQNGDKLVGAKIDGVAPSFETIAEGKYPISRSMFVYLKKAHVGVVPGLSDFMAEYVSEKASGDDGYLADKGLIPLPAAARVKNEQNVMAQNILKASDLK